MTPITQMLRVQYRQTHMQTNIEEPHAHAHAHTHTHTHTLNESERIMHHQHQSGGMDGPFQSLSLSLCMAVVDTAMLVRVSVTL